MKRLLWALRIAGRQLHATCLVEALSTHALLTRRGYQTTVTIGVNKGASGDLKAHAWVEYQGSVIVGGTMTTQYTKLLVLDETLR
jgi:hypothetical protein